MIVPERFWIYFTEKRHKASNLHKTCENCRKDLADCQNCYCFRKTVFYDPKTACVYVLRHGYLILEKEMRLGEKQ